MTPVVRIVDNQVQVLHSRDGAAAGRVHLALGRADVVLLPTRTGEAPSAQHEIERQLPADFLSAPRAVMGASVIVWPPHARAKAEGLLQEARLRIEGAFYTTAPDVPPDDHTVWLIAPRDRQRRMHDWLQTHRKALSSIAVVLFLAGLAAGHVTEGLDDDLVFLKRDRRAIASDPSPGLGTPLPFVSTAVAAVPSGVQLLDIGVDQAARTAHIRGRCADYGGVSKFRAGLSACPAVASVRPDKAGLAKVGNAQLVEFSLEVALR